MRLPVVASGADAGRNAYNAFTLGFNPQAFFGQGVQTYQDQVRMGRNPLTAGVMGVGKVAGSTLHGIVPGRGISLGGMATAGGLAGVGAAAGALIGSQMEGNMVGTGAAVGVAAGLAAIPALGVAARVGMASMRPIGMGMEATAKALPGVAKGLTEVASGLIGGPSRLSPSLATTGVGKMAEMVASPLRRHVGGIAGFGKSLVKFDEAATSLGGRQSSNLIGKLTKTGGVKMTGLGHTVMWGSTIAAAGASVFNAVNKVKMGQSDGQITRATPRPMSFENNAGATGDLVFAMNANRRG